MGNIEKKGRKNTHIYLVGCMGYIEYFHGLRQQGNFPRLFFVLTFFLYYIQCLPPNRYTPNRYILRFFGKFSKIFN